MPSLVTKPLLAASLAIPSLLLLGYLWQRRRAEEVEENTNLGLGAVDSREVSLKLENLNRSRLDCIEEEILEERVEESEVGFEPDTVDAACSNSENVPIISVQEAFEQDIPLIENCESVSTSCATEDCPTLVKEPVITDQRDQVTEVTTTIETTTTEIVENSEEITGELTEMTEKDKCTESTGKAQAVPDVISALQDPLCSLSSSPPCPSSAEKTPVLSTSPVKSESADSQRSSEAWSDLIEQDEREELERSMCEKLSSGLDFRAERNDSGVASPTEEFSRTEEQQVLRKERDDKLRMSSGEDAGIGGSETGELSDSGHGSEHSSTEDTQLLAYHFYVQDYLCGPFIGASGSNIKKMKQLCNCNITLKDDSRKSNSSNQKRHQSNSRDRSQGEYSSNLCIIEGTRANIDKCLDLIRDRFCRNPELTLEQVNKPENTNLALYNGSVTLSLAEGIMHDVFVVSIVNGAHIFLQQPAHPTFSALERLSNCMYYTYSELSTPELCRPILPNTICVVCSNGFWYRCQVTSFDEVADVCDIKYIDYGGYDTVPANQLKQIRTDFLSLPFQAIECHLANIVPTEEDSVSAGILEELVSGQAVQARMIGLNEDGVPMIHLYRACAGQTVMVNKELVDRSCANWIEATIIPISSAQLSDNWNILGDSSPSVDLPLSVMQIKYFANLTNNITRTHFPQLFPPSVEEAPSHEQTAPLAVADPPGVFLPGRDQDLALPSSPQFENELCQLGDPPTNTTVCSGISQVDTATDGAETSVQPYSPIGFLPGFGSTDGSVFEGMSPGQFLQPYRPLDLGNEYPSSYLQWSNTY